MLASRYVWNEGDWCRVVSGPHTGAHGMIDFVDRKGGRALIKVEGRFGGLTWVRLKDLHQQADFTIPIGDMSPCAGCGHSKSAHEGHTVQVGAVPPTHCSQLCGCKAYLPRIGA